MYVQCQYHLASVKDLPSLYHQLCGASSIYPTPSDVAQAFPIFFSPAQLFACNPYINAEGLELKYMCHSPTTDCHFPSCPSSPLALPPLIPSPLYLMLGLCSFTPVSSTTSSASTAACAARSGRGGRWDNGHVPSTRPLSCSPTLFCTIWRSALHNTGCVYICFGEPLQLRPNWSTYNLYISEQNTMFLCSECNA